VLALVAALPATTRLPAEAGTATSRVWRRWRDGIAAGILLTVLFFTKMTYFAAGLGLVAAAMLTTRRPADWRFAAGAVLVLALVVTMLEATTGLVHFYLADLRMAAAASGNPLRPKFALELASFTIPCAAVVVVLGILDEWNPQRPWAVWLPRTLMALAIVGAGLLIGIQNHPALESPLLPIAALVAGAGALGHRPPRRTGSIDTDPPAAAGSPRKAALAAAMGALTLAALSVIQDAGALAWTVVAPRATGPQVSWLARTPLADMAMGQPLSAPPPEDAPPVDISTGLDLAAVIGEGIGLLEPRLAGRRDAIVLSFTFSNPFPVLLGLPAVPHELAWWDEGRSFTAAIKPDAGALFAAVDYVMVPSRYNNIVSTQAMQAAYAATLARDFKPMDRSATWTLYARRDCGRRGLC